MTASKRAPADGYTFVLVDHGNATVLSHLLPKSMRLKPWVGAPAVLAKRQETDLKMAS